MILFWTQQWSLWKIVLYIFHVIVCSKQNYSNIIQVPKQQPVSLAIGFGSLITRMNKEHTMHAEVKTAISKILSRQLENK